MRTFEKEVLQVETEITRFAEILTLEGVTSYLEVGTKFGGSFWRAARALPVGSRVVAVDMPRGTKMWPVSEGSLKECVAELKRLGYDAHLIWGDSTSPDIIEQVRALGPFDAIFLDGNHTAPFVKADTQNYLPMAEKLFAYHDIGWRRAPEWVGTRIDVPEFWNEIKDDYRHEEIKLCETGKNNGIGVLWL